MSGSDEARWRALPTTITPRGAPALVFADPGPGGGDGRDRIRGVAPARGAARGRRAPAPAGAGARAASGACVGAGRDRAGGAGRPRRRGRARRGVRRRDPRCGAGPRRPRRAVRPHQPGRDRITGRGHPGQSAHRPAGASLVARGGGAERGARWASGPTTRRIRSPRTAAPSSPARRRSARHGGELGDPAAAGGLRPARHRHPAVLPPGGPRAWFRSRPGSAS